MPDMQYCDHSSLIVRMLAKNSERKLFMEFLNSEDEGVSVTDRLYNLAEDEVKETAKRGNLKLEKEEVVEAVIKGYKNRIAESGLSCYDEIVLSLIEAEYSEHDLITKIKRKKISLDYLPSNFPGMRKKAETLFKGKVAADLKPKDFFRYAVEKQYAAILREYARDLFFVVNGGDEEKAVDFLRLMYELNKMKTSEPFTPGSLRSLILEKMRSNGVLEIVHIKCLRFTYPEGLRLKILDHTDGVEQASLPGETRFYPDEEVIFQRIENLRKILERARIKTKVNCIVSDHDLNYCFPDEQNIVPKEDVEAGKMAVENYLANLKRLHPETNRVRSLTEFLEENGLAERFNEIFTALVREGERGGGKFIREKMLETRVNELFEHYNKMFNLYSRGLARYTTIRQLADLFSLAVVFESFSSKPLLVIDSRGFEDKLIGGYNPGSVVKFFTQLEDPEEITKLK